MRGWMEHRDGWVYICRPWVTRNGKRVYAKSLGLKAFCFWVRADPDKK